MIRYRKKSRRVFFVSRGVRNLPVSNCGFACLHSVRGLLASIRLGTIALLSAIKDVYTRSSVLLQNLAYRAQERKEHLCVGLFAA